MTSDAHAQPEGDHAHPRRASLGGGELVPSYWSSLPQTPVYANGRQYMTNCFAGGPTHGESIAVLYLMTKGQAMPVAAVGSANQIDLLKTDAFKPLWPQGVDLKGEFWANTAIFTWSDLNDDHQMQPDEVQMTKGHAGSITVNPGLVMTRTIDATAYTPLGFTKGGAPIYDITKGKALCPGARSAGTSGGDQVLIARNGWTVMTHSPQPVTPVRGLAGAKNGKPVWAYPVKQLGLHASAHAPMPKYPGYLIGTTRLLGPTVTPKGTQEELWAINGNFGNT